jgi:glycerophosphoryl diester phosphodiesterase
VPWSTSGPVAGVDEGPAAGRPAGFSGAARPEHPPDRERPIGAAGDHEAGAVTAVFAHRGATATHRENTLEAFEEARRLGADGVELDVRRSADGALVIHHDAAIEGLGRVADLAVGSLPAHVPLLVEALEVCAGMIVNVEIKNSEGDPGYDPSEAISVATAAAIAEAGWSEQVIVSSFSPAAIEAARNADPHLVVGWLLEWTASGSECLAQAIGAGYGAIHPFVTQVDADLVATAHDAGVAVNVWTVNSLADLRSMADLGVDAVITDQVLDAIGAVRGA